MNKFLIFAVIALMGFNSIKAQEVAFTDTEIDNLSAIGLSDIDGLTLNNRETVSSIQEKGMKFGIIGGLVCSTIYGDEADSFDNRIGLHFGVMGTRAISDDFAIHGELLYAAMGSDFEEEGFEIFEAGIQRGGGGDISGTFKLDYLILLIAAQYSIAEGLTLEAGPQVGFLLSAKDEFVFDGISEEEDVKDQTKGLDVGVSGGVGYEFDLGLYLKARYYLGLLEVNDFMFPGNESWKNSALFVSAGFFFN